MHDRGVRDGGEPVCFGAVDRPIEGLALRLQLADCVELAGERLATPRQSVPAAPPGLLATVPTLCGTAVWLRCF